MPFLGPAALAPAARIGNATARQARQRRITPMEAPSSPRRSRTVVCEASRRCSASAPGPASRSLRSDRAGVGQIARNGKWTTGDTPAAPFGRDYLGVCGSTLSAAALGGSFISNSASNLNMTGRPQFRARRSRKKPRPTARTPEASATPRREWVVGDRWQRSASPCRGAAVTDSATLAWSTRRPGQAAGDKDVLVHGAAVARSALAAGVLYELEIHLIPGAPRPGTPPVRPPRAPAHRAGAHRIHVADGVTHMRYRVQR